MPHMYVSHFWGEELLDSGLLGRGKIQEKMLEYIPLSFGGLFQIFLKRLLYSVHKIFCI